MFELSFAQEYGPRIVLTVVLLVVTVALAVIGRGAARAYERTITSTAEHFWSMTKGRRGRKRDSIHESQQELSEKASNARRLADIAICLGATAIITVWVRTGLDFTEWEADVRSLVALGIGVVVLGSLWQVSKRRSTALRERLRPAIDLEEKETSAP